ncbi:chromosome segregation protein SMC [Serratia sp. S1B]|nr:chromosome segregation protein SMC [Serratia sp. S1B]
MKDVTNSDQLSRIVINGYKSIAKCDLEMGCLNVLIGANGAGKSNFISYLSFLSEQLSSRLALRVAQAGGPDAILHYGRKVTERLSTEIHINGFCYESALVASNDNRFFFEYESVFSTESEHSIGTFGHHETAINQFYSHGTGANKLDTVIDSIRSWCIYHFQDTSQKAKVKQIHRINDNDYLREDGANLAAFLFRVQKNHPSHYQRIIRTIRMVAPYFGDFYLRATPDNQDSIQLEWTEKDHDIPFKASELSDGTLRFILLATVLLQPEEFIPSTIIVDEPELGLHPYAINVLAGLIKSASNKHQLIISTQSVELVNQFDAEDLIVVDKHNGSSTFKRFDTALFSDWLEDYSLGDLWKKNLLGGRPQS